MRNILHSLQKNKSLLCLPWVLCGTAHGAEVPFCDLGDVHKECIVDVIRSHGNDDGFIVTYESLNGYRWYKDDQSLTLSGAFGLAQANCLFSSWSDERIMTNGLSRCYIYPAEDSSTDFASISTVFSNGSFFDDQVCRFMLVKRQNAPLKTRFRPFRSRSKLSSEIVTWDSVWDYEVRPGIKMVDKSQFMAAFSNNVYTINGGMFVLKEEAALNIVKHDFRRGRVNVGSEFVVKTRPRLGDAVIIDPREISEVVYWLWRRKGKTDEYAGFVKAHPELFEPIASEDEFRTELGRRLIGTWK